MVGTRGKREEWCYCACTVSLIFNQGTRKDKVMSITINVGVNKKIGLPDYGSAGGHCNIEIEADNSILDNPDQFLQRVRNAYELARQSVEEELSHHRQVGDRPNDRQGNAPSQSHATPAPTQQKQEYQQDYRSNHPTGNTGGGNSGGSRIASPKQQQFIASLVKAVKGLDWRTLDRYCDVQFGKTCSQLTPREASALIDELKEAKEGRKTIAA